MTVQSVRAQLAQHPFSKEFKPHQIDRLAALAREVSFPPDHIVFREGDQVDEFYLTVTGRVALEMVVGDKVLRIQTLGDGDEFGWSSLITGSGKQFQARTLEPVVALAFHGELLLQACREDGDFGFQLMQRLMGIVAERLHGTRLQLIDTYSPVAKRAGA